MIPANSTQLAPSRRDPTALGVLGQTVVSGLGDVSVIARPFSKQVWSIVLGLRPHLQRAGTPPARVQACGSDATSAAAAATPPLIDRLVEHRAPQARGE